jgi:hypothetical protein
MFTYAVSIASEPPQPPATIIAIADTSAASESPAPEKHNGDDPKEDVDGLDQDSGSSFSSDSSDEPAICTICTLPIACGDSVLLVPCFHREFCGECIFTWLRRRQTCPLCRTCVAGVRTLEKLVIIDSDDETEGDEEVEERGTGRGDEELDDELDMGLWVYRGGRWQYMALF